MWAEDPEGAGTGWNEEYSHPILAISYPKKGPLIRTMCLLPLQKQSWAIQHALDHCLPPYPKAGDHPSVNRRQAGTDTTPVSARRLILNESARIYRAFRTSHLTFTFPNSFLQTHFPLFRLFLPSFLPFSLPPFLSLFLFSWTKEITGLLVSSTGKVYQWYELNIRVHSNVV